MTEVRYCQACGKPLPASARFVTPPVEFVVCPSCGSAVAVMPLHEQDIQADDTGAATQRVQVSGRSFNQKNDLADLIRRRMHRPSPWPWAFAAIVVIAIAVIVYSTTQNRAVVSSATAVPAVSVPDATRVVAVFYDAIGKRDYGTAWSMLSPAFQSSTSFARFKAGYASTQSVQAQESAIAGDPQKVRTAVDATDLVNGVPVHTHLEGWWTLTWSSSDHRWLLDQGHFTKTSR